MHTRKRAQANSLTRLVRLSAFFPPLLGSARHLLKTYFPEGMSEALIGNILFGAIRGLNYMHQNGYIHRQENVSAIGKNQITVSSSLRIQFHFKTHFHLTCCLPSFFCIPSYVTQCRSIFFFFLIIQQNQVCRSLTRTDIHKLFKDSWYRDCISVTSVLLFKSLCTSVWLCF